MAADQSPPSPSSSPAPASEEKVVPPPTPSAPAKLRVAGAWAGMVEVDLETWTLPMLRREIASRALCPPPCISLISAGKVLRDSDDEPPPSLIQIGLKSNSKILASRVAVDVDKKVFRDEAERASRLARVRDASLALAKRHADGSISLDDFNLELEDQNGKKVQFGSETDQQGLMVGLMLHSTAKQLLKKEQYKDALEALLMSEESFSLCDPKVASMIDNVSIMQVDIVWCYFMLRDISLLSMAGLRLKEAREGLQRVHGKDAERVRLLNGGLPVELALYLRLELLEGVVAYHSGFPEQAQKALTSAQAKFQQLQVADEDLSMLLSMGYTEKAAQRALRMTQNVAGAVDFLIEERAKEVQKYEENIKRDKEIKEQRRYGMTPLRKVVNIEMLNALVELGYEKLLAAEALRRNENDIHKALDDLSNPDTNSDLQCYLHSKSRKKFKRSVSVEGEELISMGFDRSRVLRALGSSKTKEQALTMLLSDTVPEPPEVASAAVSLDEGRASADSLPAGEMKEEGSSDTNNINDEEGSSGTKNVNDEEESSGIKNVNDEEGSSGTKNVYDEEALFYAEMNANYEERDAAMEGEITQEITGDAIGDYDLDITKEGKAIAEYLALLTSA